VRHIYNLSQEIHRRKEAVPADVFLRLWNFLVIILLEIALNILSLPLYLTPDHKKHPETFNTPGFAYCLYKKRKKVTLSTILSMIFFISFYTGVTLFGIIRANLTKAATITWVGAGADTNWSTAANWSTNSVPTATDIVVFDGTNTGNSTIDSGFSGTVAGVQINSGYTGTITQARSLTISGNFLMATSTGGTFLGSADNIDINGNFTVIEGTFQATSATTSSPKWGAPSRCPSPTSPPGTVIPSAGNSSNSSHTR
jgi:hypothetical protein